MGLQIYDEHTPDTGYQNFALADGTNLKQLVSANQRGVRYDHIIVSSTSLADHDLQLFPVEDETVILCTVTIPAGAGLSPSVPAIDLIASLPAGMDGIILMDGDILCARLLTSLATGKFVTVYWTGGKF
jgi:hypothetical protein